jgi:hypothetical protein
MKLSDRALLWMASTVALIGSMLLLAGALMVFVL